MSTSIRNKKCTCRDKKYLCIGNNKIKAKWLPRWYGVPHEECIFFNNSWEFEHRGESHHDCIILTPLSEGSDYKQHLYILKTEHLIYGNDIRQH